MQGWFSWNSRSLLQATHPKSKGQDPKSLESENCRSFSVVILFDGQKVFTFFHLHCISARNSLKYHWHIIYQSCLYIQPTIKKLLDNNFTHSLQMCSEYGCGGANKMTFTSGGTLFGDGCTSSVTGKVMYCQTVLTYLGRGKSISLFTSHTHKNLWTITSEMTKIQDDPTKFLGGFFWIGTSFWSVCILKRL